MPSVDARGPLGAAILALSLPSVGCSMFSPNSMSARGNAPFKLGKVASALWFEERWADPEDGEGAATILLVDKETDCDEFLEELDGSVDPEDSLLWEAAGVLISVGWMMPEDDDGYEGEYYSGMYPLYSYAWYEDPPGAIRTFNATAFADGYSWSEDYGLGHLEIKEAGDLVKGNMKTDWIKARFQAEDCGQEPGQDDDWDSGGWIDG